ncbi:MAG: hypothetical protein ACXWYB_13625 [Aeromicrobium sp.]
MVGGYLADGEVRLSPATLEFYRKGQRAAADVQAAPGVDGDPAGARQPSAELATPARASKAIAELAERRDELDAALLEAVPSAVPSHRCSSGHPAGPSRIITA